MSKPNNNTNMSEDNVEEICPVQDFVGKFFMYLVNETGLTKQSFTRRGLQNYVKNIAKKCYQLKLWDELLSVVIKLAALFCKSLKGDLEGAVHEFVMILNKIVNFLAKYYLGVGLLVITATMGEGMAAFLVFLYYLAVFAIEFFSATWFLKLKDWILMLCKSKSENVTRFFEEIFPTYGRTLTMA